jgi:hypothetical protein
VLRPQNKNLKAPIKAGEVRNPVGRPIGSRSKFSEAMVADFLADWHEHGTDVLARVRMTEPATYLRVAAVLVPKEMKVEVDNRGPLDRPEMQMMRKLIDLIQAHAPVGADHVEVFAVLEDALRSHFAKPVGK